MGAARLEEPGLGNGTTAKVAVGKGSFWQHAPWWKTITKGYRSPWGPGTFTLCSRDVFVPDGPALGWGML